MSLATPLVSETVQAKWFAQFPFVPRSYWLTLLPLATLVAGIWVWRATGRLKKDAAAPDWTAFAGAISIFALAFAGLLQHIPLRGHRSHHAVAGDIAPVGAQDGADRRRAVLPFLLPIRYSRTASFAAKRMP